MQKLPKLWKATKGAGGAWHVYWKTKKLNLRTADMREADRRRRALVAGTLTPEDLDPTSRQLPPVGDDAAPESPAQALEAAFEASEAPAPPQTPPNAPHAAPEALGAAPVQPDGYRSPEGWAADLGAAAGATEEANAEPPPGVDFDGGELLDMAAAAIAGATETVGRAVLAKRGRKAPPIPADFPIRKLLEQSWSAQLRIWVPTGEQIGPGTGILLGTVGLWAIMGIGSQAMSDDERAAAAEPPAPAQEAAAAA